MPLPTTYQSSSRGTLVIADMHFSHTKNAINALERKHTPDSDPTLQALRAHLESFPPQEGGPAAPPPADAAEFAPNPRVAMGGNNPPPYAVILAERHAGFSKRVDQAIADAKAITTIETEEQHDIAVEVVKRLIGLNAEAGSLKDTEKAELKPTIDAIDGFFLTRGVQGRLGPTTTALRLLDGKFLQAKADAEREAANAAAALARAESTARAAEAAQAEEAGQHTIAEVKMAGALAHEEHAEKVGARASAPAAELARTHSSAGTASLRTSLAWNVDRDALDLNALRAFFDDAAIDAAIRSMVKARGWKGVDLVQLKDRPAPTKSIKGVSFYEKAAGSYR